MPLPIICDKDCEMLAHPHLFPTGVFGYTYEWEVKLSPCRYFNQRFLNYTQKFSSDSDYIFHAQSLLQHLNLNNSIIRLLKKYKLKVWQPVAYLKTLKKLFLTLSLMIEILSWSSTILFFFRLTPFLESFHYCCVVFNFITFVNFLGKHLSLFTFIFFFWKHVFVYIY